jgi:hypothetical protein
MKIKWKKIVYPINNLFFSYIKKKKLQIYLLFCFEHPGHYICLKSNIHPPITTDVVSSNLDQGEVYNIMW